MDIIRCPRCGKYVKIHYVDTAGAHWTCPNCGRDSDSYTLVYDSKTHSFEEIPLCDTDTPVPKRHMSVGMSSSVNRATEYPGMKQKSVEVSHGTDPSIGVSYGTDLSIGASYGYGAMPSASHGTGASIGFSYDDEYED